MTGRWTQHGTGPARHGFTLIEVLTVVALVALLAGLIVGVASVALERNSQAKNFARMNHIKSALDEYRIEYGSYVDPGTANDVEMTNPSYIDDFEVLTNFSANITVPEDDFTDVWGNPYIYRYISAHGYELTSRGPDGTNATNDDITQ